MHREEEQLIPLACASLTDDDWYRIQAAFASNTDPLFGAECAAEYRALYERIAELTHKTLKSLVPR